MFAFVLLLLAQNPATLVGPTHAPRDYFTQLVFSGTECDGAVPSLTGGEAITVTRSSGKTCVRANGTTAWLTANQPAVNSTGWQVEGGSTNQILYSEQLNNVSGWATVSGTVNVTADGCTAPDGTSSAELLQAATAGAVYGSVSATSSSSSVTGSVYVSTTSGTQSMQLKVWNATTSAYVGSTASLTATTTPQRVVVAGASLTSGNAYQLHILPGGAGTGTVCAWGAQGESRGSVTSYIPTTSAAATRGAENASFTPSQSLSSVGCTYASVLGPPSIASGSRIVGTAGTDAPLFVSSTTLVGVSDGTNTATGSTGTSFSGGSHVLRSGWGDSALNVNGTSGAGTGTFDGTMSASTLFIGSQNGSSNFFNGYIRALRVGNTASGCQ